MASYLEKLQGKVLIEKFPDGEIDVRILENVRSRDVFIVQSTVQHPQLLSHGIVNFNQFGS